jgi:hypothetical protein
MEKAALYRTENEKKFLEISRASSDIRAVNVVPVGYANSKTSGFYELSKRSLDMALKEYEEMPTETKAHSVFFFHSFDMMKEGVPSDKSHGLTVFDSTSHISASGSTTTVSEIQVYDQVISTQRLDLISASLKVRQFIEAIIHVRLSLESSEKPPPGTGIGTISSNNGKLRKLIGSKIQLNVFVADMHVALYQSVLSWVLGLSPSLERHVVSSVQVGSVVLCCGVLRAS